MAKKKRSKKARRRRKAQKTTAAVARPKVTAAPVEARPKAAAQPASKAQKYQVDFRKEYPYIYSDLERVGIIAAAMLAFMIALSFILR